jgi:hypothetical protein
MKKKKQNFVIGDNNMLGFQRISNHNFKLETDPDTGLPTASRNLRRISFEDNHRSGGG